MSQLFDERGNVVPITLLEAGPCYITEIKTKEKDGYEAVQFGFEKLKPNKIKKSEKGKGFRYLRELRVNGADIKNYQLEKEMTVADFAKGDKVRVSALNKGKGFQGAVKKWGFHGRNATHGVKHEERTLGSVGSTGPGRVMPGKKMPGRMGSQRTDVKNLEVVKIDQENNLIAVKGAVPGRRGSLVEVKK